MKKLFITLISAFMAAAIVLTSCQPKEQPNNPQHDLQETLKVATCNPSEGTEVVATEVSAITLTFTTPIQLDLSRQITLNDKVLNAEKQTSTLTLPVSLDYETAYTLQIPAGAIRSMRDTLTCNPAFTLHFTTKVAPKEPITGLPDNDAMAVTRRLGFGWNLGNHFDTSSSKDGLTKPQWGYWDQQATPTQSLYSNLAAAGVKTVRICCTWGDYQSTDGSYTIPTAYMEEIAQNVAWARNAGLMVVINTHHDEYWQDVKGAAGNTATNTLVKNRIVATWTQIANRFKEEGDYLIMETFNEIHDMKNNDWNGNASMYKIVNEWNQLAVNTIRETGSNNATRYIAIPQYAASPRNAMNNLVLPNDPAGEGKLIVAVHCYDPYNFTLANPLTDNLPQYELDAVVKLLNQLKATYIDNNIPCYLGEFGCSAHNTSIGQKRRTYYFEYFCRAAYFAGLAGCIWDNFNPGAGSEHHAYFDHNDGKFVDDGATLIPMMVKAMTSTDANYTLESIKASAPN